MLNSIQPSTIEIQGHSITYYREGKGEPVIFIHGITTYSFIWQKIIPYLTDKYDVIVIDMLGCGDSDKPLSEDFSLKRQSTIIHDFCIAQSIDKCNLVCHDVGGGVGQIIAVNYPEMIDRLILINTVAYNFWPVQPIVTMRTPIIRQIAMASLDFGMFELIIKRGLYHVENLSEELMQQFWKPMRDPVGRKGFLHFAKCLDNKDLTTIEGELRQLTVPTLIIRGEADIYLMASIANKLHSEIPNSTLDTIKTGGHFIQEDEPEEVSKLILNFLSR